MKNNTIILGVCNAQVSGASIIIDSEIVSSVNEERFTRVKNDRSFPRKSIEYCLENSSLKPEVIDFVACGAWKGIDEKFLPQCMDDVLKAILNDSTAEKLLSDRTRVAVERDHRFKKELIEQVVKIGFPEEKISFYDHHLSHAFTAFYPSPFEDALVLTIDQRGDFKSATVCSASRKDGIELLDSVSMYNSLGSLYAYITNYLGFTPNKHEGKVTGLAAYGDHTKCVDIITSMIDYKEGKIIANIGEKFSPFPTNKLPNIEKELDKFSKEDISAAVQYVTEDITLKYLSKFIAETGLRNICVAGGLFGNVKLNQKIYELEDVDNIYVFPQMGDGGNALGGALIKLYENGGSIKYPLKHVYLGPKYSKSEISEVLNRYNTELNITSLNDYTLKLVAKDISDGKYVGIFKGRMEYGPRALGARSIIVRATDKDITKILNKRLNRTEFMPFAPITLEEYAHEYYVGWKKEHLASYFMTLCYVCTERANKETPGIVHVDNTARPQIVNSDFNRLYYDLLLEYYNLTGIPTLINTSFNNHEEPIVCSPEDAIKSLLIQNADYILFEDFIVSKK